MKVVLFYPKTDKHNTNMQLPLPVLAVGSDLMSSGHDVRIIDERTEPDYEKRLSCELGGDDIIFGVSVMTGYQIKGGLAASRFVKSLGRGIKVIWGGWHVSMLPEESMADPSIDACVVGPGEGVIQELCEKVASGAGLSGINGVVYKEGGRIVNNASSGKLEMRHMISRDVMKLIDFRAYIHDSFLGSKSIFWVTSKGCPYNCGFCCSAKVYNRRWEGFDALRILEWLEWFAIEHGINGVNFVDTNFFVNKDRVSEIMRGLIRKGLKIRWAASVRVDQINMLDREFLALLKNSGCAKLFVGAESGSRKVLDLIDKRIDVDDILRMAGMLDEAGITAEMFVMAGFPVDPVSELDETLALVKKIKMLHPNHQFASFIYTPYPGTPLYGLALENGLKAPSDLEGWVSWNMTEVMTPWLKAKGYGDRLHSFVKMYYPLAFPSDDLKRKFGNAGTGWIYRILHKLESFRVRNNFFLLPLEWPMMKLAGSVRDRYSKLRDLVGGFR